MSTTASPSPWARLFGVVRPFFYRVEAKPKGVLIQSPGGLQEIPFSRVVEVTVEKGWFWSRVRIAHSSGNLTLNGLPKPLAAPFRKRVEANRLAYVHAMDVLAQARPVIEAVHPQVEALTRDRVALALAILDGLLSKIQSIEPALRIDAELLPDDPLLKGRLQDLRSFLAHSQSWRVWCQVQELLTRLRPRLDAVHADISELTSGRVYAARHLIEAALGELSSIRRALDTDAELLPDDPLLRRKLRDLREFLTAHDALCKQANERFIANETKAFEDYFDTVEKHPLTKMQRRAVVIHEDNTLVIAGAGSGKTSVIVAKAGYLLKKGLCKPEELLLVAFNRSAAKEMAERVESRLGAAVAVGTFHSLGLAMLAEVEGRKPSLARSAEDEVKREQLLRSMIKDCIFDPEVASAVRCYFQSFFAPYHSHFEFENWGEYYAYLEEHELRSLQGDRVKSFEECEIANFLYLNGVPYEYERPYPIDTATVRHRQYQPDFYLTEHGIYIEHFAIRRDGSTPGFIDQREYLDGMAWKRQLHAEHGTPLIETYSYQKRDGILLSELERALKAADVACRPIPLEEALKRLKADHYMDDVTQLLGTFLNHFKGGGHTLDGVRERARQRQLLSDRMEAFLKVFGPVLDRYERALARSKEIDFNDMIIRAARYAESGRYRSPYTCILVDEFQDISVGRARLVKALADQAPSHRLFCVGDDWQAIYRFAGSDIALMRDFEHHFGPTATVKLDKTFRFNDRIEAVATRFVLANPSQIAKTVGTQRKARGPAVFVHRPTRKGELMLDAALEKIQKSADEDKCKVLLLGRYNFEKGPLSSMAPKFPSLTLEFLTVHRAKGLEADYVVVLGLRAGRYGFPSEIADDPILEVVLAEPEGFPHAEERRLFYVALTRACHAVHLLADRVAPSSFLAEITGNGYEVATLGAAGAEPVYCPACRTGTLIQRTSSNGVFYSCSHYPYCDYKTDPCRRCGTGLMRFEAARNAYICTNSICEHTERVCPRCGTGRLVERSGRYGPFLGCTGYAGSGCCYTEKIGPRV